MPRLVESRSGRGCYNLALGGGQAPATYFLLRRTLESGARPSAILVDFFPRLMQHEVRLNLDNWPHLLTFRECVEMAWVARDGPLAAALILRKALPTVGHRRVARKNLARCLAGEPPRRRNALLFRRHWGVNDGAQIMAPGQYFQEDLATWCRGHFPMIRNDPTNAAFAERFLRLASRSGITVYWLAPPLTPALHEECVRSGFDREYTCFLRALASTFENVVIVDGRRAGYDPGGFFDPHHLAREGAAAYSLALGEVLTQRPPGSRGSRWIVLPPYRPAPAELLPEDLDQTQEIIAKKVQAARWW